MKVTICTAVLVLAIVVGGGSRARAGDGDDDDDGLQPLPVPQPVLTAGGERHEAPISRQWFDLAATYSRLSAAASDDIADAYSLQIAAGPKRFSHGVDYMLGDVLGWLDKYSWRARWTHVQMHDGPAREGPLVIAAQRFFQPETLNIETLIHLHVGLEATIATPWLDDRRVMPPAAFRKLYAVETELSHNGYSIQPLGGYLRADLLLCRNLFAELGISPEAFIPTEHEATNEYGVRWHAAVGFNLACSSDPDSGWRPLAISFEVKGRGRLDSKDGAPRDDALDSIALQYHFGSSLVVNAFGSRATGVPLDQYFMFGVRLQIGLGERSVQ